MVVHQWRHQRVRKANGAGRTEKEEVVVLHFGLERVIRLVAPVGQQAVDADRIDNRARKDVRADFGPLLEYDDRKVRIDLFQPDRSCKAGRP